LEEKLFWSYFLELVIKALFQKHPSSWADSNSQPAPPQVLDAQKPTASLHQSSYIYAEY
jgi:hypothetical protein